MDQIDLIRSKVDLVELISSYIPLKKAGRNFKALCPFHSEKTPSFIISPERQIWKCFGCSLGGDVFRFLMEYEKMSFAETLHFLADKTGVKLTGFKPSTAQQEKERLLAINHLASEFYHYVLLNHPAGKQGLAYLLNRGIGQSVIETFKLGYAPNNWDTLLNYLVKKKTYQTQDLEKAGLIINKSHHPSSIIHDPSNYYDRFRGRIMFPLTDQRSNILGFSGRTISSAEDLPRDRQEAKYINSPETILYHKGELFYGLHLTKEAIKKKDQTVIVEGEFDLISSYQAGIKNVAAIKGSALTEPQVNLIKRFCSTIILALDTDAAGDAAVRRGIEIADNAGLNIRVSQPKYGKDPDECARHSPGLWKESINQAMPVFDFYLQSVVNRFDKDSVEGKKKISEEIIPLLAKITNEVIKAHYFKKLADTLKVEEETIIKEMERLSRLHKISFSTSNIIQPEQKIDKKTRRDLLEELLLGMLLQNDKEIINLINQINIEHFYNPAIKKILSFLKKFLLKNNFVINKFVAGLPEELVETVDRLYLQELRDILKDKSTFAREMEKAKQELEWFYLKDQLSHLAQKIREKEKQNIKEGVEPLREEFNTLSKQLKQLS